MHHTHVIIHIFICAVLPKPFLLTIIELKITTYIFYETNSPTTYFLNAERNDSVDRALDLGLKCFLVGVSQILESLPCVVEQDTLSAA